MPGCRSKKAQKKLLNHFDYAQQRDYYLEVAKRVPRKDSKKKVIPKIKSQLTLHQVVKPPSPDVSSDEDAKEEAPTTAGTRGFPRYDIKGDTTLISFCHHPQSMDGKDKSEKVANEMFLNS